MSENGNFESEEEISDSHWIDGLDSFLKETQHLFTLMGVFGAIAVYLSRVRLPSTGADQIPFEHFVYSGAFGIVLLLAGMILIKIFQEIRSNDKEIYEVGNILLIIFLLLFGLIIPPIIAHLSTFQRMTIAIALLGVYIIGGLLFMNFINLIDSNGYPERISDRFGFSKFYSEFSLLLGIGLIGVGYMIALENAVGEVAYQSIVNGQNYEKYFFIRLVSIFVSIWGVLALTMAFGMGLRKIYEEGISAIDFMIE